MSTREAESYNVDKFIKLPKKEKVGVLEELAHNFFSTTSTNVSHANSSRVTSKDMCLAVPIESNQYSIRFGDDTLANIFSARLSQIVGKPLLEGHRRQESDYVVDASSVPKDIEVSVPERFVRNNSKDDIPRFSEDQATNFDVNLPISSEFFHKRSKSDIPLSRSGGSQPVVSNGSTMATTLVNERIQFTPSCYHKKLKVGSRRKPTLPNLYL